MVKVLLSGFEPFGGETINPSWEVAEQLTAAPPAGMNVQSVRLPVVRFQAIERVFAAIVRFQPDLVIAMGQAGGRSRVSVERIAINVDDYRLADNAGNQPDGEPIVAGAPAAYWCTLPVKRMVQAMEDAAIPAALSNSAGTYLCNHVAFGILHNLAERQLSVPAGFIHLPYLPEQTVGKRGEVASMSRSLMLAGVRIALETAGRGLGAQAPVPTGLNREPERSTCAQEAHRQLLAADRRTAWS